MNFKKYYINGNRFTFTFSFHGERYWNSFMYYLTRKTTKKRKVEKLINNVVIEPIEIINERYMPERPENKNVV